MLEFASGRRRASVRDIHADRQRFTKILPHSSCYDFYERMHTVTWRGGTVALWFLPQQHRSRYHDQRVHCLDE